ncbi:MAG: hypothetical protein R3B06_29890 [Kofleriaceae bacterium]
MLGPDRQPLRLPLDVTAADLVDLCGAGTFRIDAIDDAGQVLDFITTITVGVDGTAHDTTEPDPLPPVLMRGGGGGGELRYALEVTAHMARAQSDALRSIATAQADWIKGLAAAKVLPRNGLWHLPPPPVANANDQDDDNDDQDDDDAPPPIDPTLGALGHLASIAREVGPIVRAVIPGGNRDPVVVPRNGAPSPAAPAPAAPAPGADLATPSIRIAMVLAQVSPRARALACRLLARNDDTARNIATVIQALPVDEAAAHLETMAREVDDRRAARHRGAAAPPPVDPTAHLAAVLSKLAPDEIARAQALIATLDPARLDALKAELLAMSAADAAAQVRQVLAQHGVAGGGRVGA